MRRKKCLVSGRKRLVYSLYVKELVVGVLELVFIQTHNGALSNRARAVKLVYMLTSKGDLTYFYEKRSGNDTSIKKAIFKTQ